MKLKDIIQLKHRLYKEVELSEVQKSKLEEIFDDFISKYEHTEQRAPITTPSLPCPSEVTPFKLPDTPPFKLPEVWCHYPYNK